MNAILIEILVILLLVVANGVFALSEMAVVSSRRARLGQMANRGSKGARAALELSESPDRFLSTVQIGITLIGILAGAVSGATLVDKLAQGLAGVPVLAPYADAASLAAVVAAITYLSLVIGELVPKRLALNDPESVATTVAGPMRVLSSLAAPVVHLLTASTNLVLRVIRAKPPGGPAVTTEEIRVMIAEGARVGVVEQAEYRLVEGVFRLDELRVSVLARPRRDIQWIDANASAEELRQLIAAEPHARYLVCEGSLDHVLGVLRLKDILPQALAGLPIDLRAALRPPLYIPERATVLDAIESLRQSGVHLGVVVDEHGSIEGIVTATDLLEAVASDLPLAEGEEAEAIVEREDGSWLLDGRLPVYDFKRLIGVESLPGESRYNTLAGFVSSRVGQIPTTGATFEWSGFRFEVVDMDGRRIDRIMVSRI